MQPIGQAARVFAKRGAVARRRYYAAAGTRTRNRAVLTDSRTGAAWGRRASATAWTMLVVGAAMTASWTERPVAVVVFVFIGWTSPARDVMAPR